MLLEAALDAGSDGVPDGLRVSVRKELIARSSMSRCNQLLASYITQRRDATKRCHLAKEMEAPEEEVSVHCVVILFPRLSHLCYITRL